MDVGNRFLPCLFNELVDFVEVELAWWQIAWSGRDEHKKYNAPFWATGWFRWRTWRCRQAGLDNLAWQMTCNNKDYTPEDDPRYGELTPQAHNAPVHIHAMGDARVDLTRLARMTYWRTMWHSVYGYIGQPSVRMGGAPSIRLSPGLVMDVVDDTIFTGPSYHLCLSLCAHQEQWRYATDIAVRSQFYLPDSIQPCSMKLGRYHEQDTFPSAPAQAHPKIVIAGTGLGSKTYPDFPAHLVLRNHGFMSTYGPGQKKRDLQNGTDLIPYPTNTDIEATI
jgi:hypothetical protein